MFKQKEKKKRKKLQNLKLANGKIIGQSPWPRRIMFSLFYKKATANPYLHHFYVINHKNEFWWIQLTICLTWSYWQQLTRAFHRSTHCQVPSPGVLYGTLGVPIGIILTRPRAAIWLWVLQTQKHIIHAVPYYFSN